MSIQVYTGHSGQRYALDADITTLEALRAWIAQQTAIQPRNQILLTAQGKQVRLQTLITETEFFVFDSSRLNAKAHVSPLSSVVTSSTSSDFTPASPPDTIADQHDLQAWQSLFQARKSWASALLSGCDARARQAEQYRDEQAIIERSLGVAVASLQQHVKSAEQKHGAARGWSDELLQDQEAHLSNWEQHLDSLRSVPARLEFTRFLQPTLSTSRRSSQQGGLTTLQAFVDVVSTRKAASVAKSLTGGFSHQLGKMRDDLDRVTRDSEELLRVVDQINAQSMARSESEPTQLLEEIEIVVKKMASDLDHVQSLPRGAQSVQQASKMALLHTRNYLPTLSDYCSEMNDLVQRAGQQRDSAAHMALEHMQTLSGIESQLAELYADIKGLELPQDDQQSFATLSVIARLPSVYGQLLVESVRRREWVAKMRRDSATLQEEVATYQDEEDKRRQKWIRSVEDVVDPDALQNGVLGIELSLQNEGGSWPMVTRDELQDYLHILSDVYGQGPVTDEMDQAIKDLDKPTRKQIKHAKAFKNGSMHEAAFGDTSLLLRGDDQHKSLREANGRLEEELRGQRSRVRKLEDLLHRQSQASRASMGDLFTPQSTTSSDRLHSPGTATPQPPEELSRNNSQKHRRLSSTTQAMEEKRLARRVVDLEAELQTLKDEATARRGSDAEALRKAEEAVLTKNDLMENMDAQQRTFADERRSLERELAETKEKIEEIENEIERLIGSRDDERTDIDVRVAAFEDEIARLKEDAMGHAARAATEQDARSAVERQLESAEAARAEAETELQQLRIEREQRGEAEAEQLQQLVVAYNHLSPGTETPNGITQLSVALEEIARRSAAHAKDLAEAVAFAKSENESLWASNERQKTELVSMTQRQSDVEELARVAEENVAAERAKTQALNQQLGEEQEQLRLLRTKFAEGETGSGILRQRIAEEENRVGKLSAELAETKSHVNSMDVELMRLQKKHKAYHVTAEVSADRLTKRAERAKDISHRLFTQNARLSRLLERLGFAVSYQDDTMVIERASKMGASTNIGETQTLNRTVTLASPPPTRKSSNADEPADLSILRWPDAQTPEDETAQFETFLQSISRFNIDTISDAVVKRVRDFEYTARKYNKEAKEAAKRAEAYKERSVKLKTAAHAKIAVKDFKEGDLALFLPTRGQAKGAWAAFNIGCPHYFLAEKEGMRLGSRDFIVARISRVEQKVVDLSKTLPPSTDSRSFDEASEAPSAADDDNPFELSDGLTWWMVHAAEERGAGGAPSTPGLGKSTVAAANVDAKGSIRIKRSSKSDDASKHLNKSLDSRRSSSTSKKGVPGALAAPLAHAGASPTGKSTPDGLSLRPRSESQTSLRPPPAAAPSNSGLGIVVDHHHHPHHQQQQQQQLHPDDAPPPNTQVRKLAEATTPPPGPAAAVAVATRSRSPSKSVRSLQRHLAPRSPAKSPVPPGKPGVWESLWQAEFSIESPAKDDR